MRTRIKEDNSAPRGHQYGTPRQGLPDDIWSWSTSQDLNKTVTTDVVTQNYKARSAAGEIINNPYSRKRTTVVQIPGTWTGAPITHDHTKNDGTVLKMWLPGVRGDWFDASFLTHAQVLIPDTTNDDVNEQRLIDLAINQAYANIDPSEASALVSLAELRQTVNYIKSTLFQVTKIIKAIKRLDLRVLRKEVEFEAIADTYMGLRYGLRPLLIDAEQAVKAFNAKRAVGTRKTARGSATDSAHLSKVLPVVYGHVEHLADGSQIDRDGRGYERNVHRSVVVRAGVLYELAPISYPELKTWGFHDIASAAFEVIPYSFILGWFVNLADTVAAWQPKAGVNILSSWYTIEREVIDQTFFTYSDYNGRSYYADGSYPTITGHWGKRFSQITAESSKERVVSPNRAGLSLDINLDIFKLIDMTLILKSIIQSK